jgi:hypothetical protein
MAYAKLPVHLGVHLGRELQVVEVLVIHAVERLGAIEKQEVELLVPHILEQLVPLGFVEADDDLVEEAVQLHAILGLVEHEVAGALADWGWHLVIHLRRDPDAE